MCCNWPMPPTSNRALRPSSVCPTAPSPGRWYTVWSSAGYRRSARSGIRERRPARLGDTALVPNGIRGLAVESRVGTAFGKYNITSLLGKGGMGEVYEAFDTDKNRPVALKILADEFSHDAT